ERIVDPGLDLLDHVLRVDIAVHLGLVLPGETDDRLLLFADGLHAHRRVVRRRGFEEAVRRHPDLELLHPRRVGADDDRLGLRLLAADWLLAAAARRGLALDSDAVHTRRGDLEIDHSFVAWVDESRPCRARAVGLAEHEVVAVARVLDRTQAVGAHR